MDILMPQLGETVAEGKITTWYKSIGDAVRPGDNLFEIETDKVSMEVPATAAGVLAEIRVGVGEVAPVGAVVAVLAAAANVSGSPPASTAQSDVDDDGPTPPPGGGRSARVSGPGGGGGGAANAASPSPHPAPSLPSPASGGGRGGGRPSPSGGGWANATALPAGQGGMAATPAAPRRVMLDPFREVHTPERNYGPARLASGTVATPLARRLAGEAGIDLARLTPSGPRGRVVGRDVEAAIAAKAGAFARGIASHYRIKAHYESGSYEEVPLSSTQLATALRLVESTAIPQLRLTADMVVERLESARAEANAAALPDQAGKPAFQLTLDDFLVRVLALALARVPAANAAWAGDRILRFKRSDIGIALPTEGGLVMPVIRGADKKPLLAVSAERAELAARARAGKLPPAELNGGASTICNLGAHGVHALDALINPPQATLLAIGAPVRRAIETDDGYRFITMINVTLSCDQRVVDALTGAELLGALRHFIEHPVGLMI